MQIGRYKPVVPILRSPDTLALQLSETLASTVSGEGFWKF